MPRLLSQQLWEVVVLIFPWDIPAIKMAEKYYKRQLVTEMHKYPRFSHIWLWYREQIHQGLPTHPRALQALRDSEKKLIEKEYGERSYG